MYGITDLCCICLKHENNLRRLLNNYEDINYYSRLILLFPEMVSTVLPNQGAICIECCSKVDDFYKFREECLRNNQIFAKYASKHSSVFETSIELLVSFDDFKNKLKNSEQTDRKYIKINDLSTDCYSESRSASDASDNNSFTIKTDKEENDDNIENKDGATNDVFYDNTSSNVDDIEEIYIKSEPVDSSEFEDELESASVSKSESRDSRTTHCISSTDNITQYNINSEAINIKTECVDDANLRSSTSVENWTPVSIDKLKNKRLNKCDICEKTFVRASYLIEHKRIHSGEKPFKCDQCDKVFSLLVYLTKHKMVHGPKNPLKCEICDKKFTGKVSLERHKGIHSGEKPFNCMICNKAFREKRSLFRHRVVHTGEKPFKCDLCDKVFSQSANLISHKRIHSDAKPFRCEQCGKEFSFLVNLTRHKLLHSGEKPFKCEHCHKAFSRSAHLDTHRRVHSGEKPFQCDQCDKTFSMKGSLLRHQRVHTGEKPFKCEHCNATFARSAHLVTHERSHSGEKPFKCDLCYKEYSEKRGLIRHKLIHTG